MVAFLSQISNHNQTLGDVYRATTTRMPSSTAMILVMPSSFDGIKEEVKEMEECRDDYRFTNLTDKKLGKLAYQ